MDNGGPFRGGEALLAGDSGFDGPIVARIRGVKMALEARDGTSRQIGRVELLLAESSFDPRPELEQEGAVTIGLATPPFSASVDRGEVAAFVAHGAGCGLAARRASPASATVSCQMASSRLLLWQRQ